MELRLFNRSRDLRLVRPHRVPLLEWLRSVKHNIACELTLLADEGRVRIRQAFKRIEGTPLPGLAPGWTAHLRSLLNGKRAALSVRVLMGKLRKRGLTPGFWPLIFVIGLLIGIGTKYTVGPYLTIGYEDYTLPAAATQYDLNAIETRLKLAPETDPESVRREYPACPLQS